MNKKLYIAFMMIFFATCGLCIITDLVFPYFMHIMKALIMIGIAGFIWIAMLYIYRYLKAFNRKKKETVYNLIFRYGIKSSMVNICTAYRIIIAPVLLVLLFKEITAFKWLLLSAFITDALDGYLARRWKVTTKLGARMDSLADDFLFVVSLIALLYLHNQVIIDHLMMIGYILFIFTIKMILLYFKHKKIISGMHTYLAKASAFLQSLFFIQSFFFQPSDTLFYITSIVTALAIVEEIIIIYALRQLKQNIKGIFFIKSQM